MYRRQRIIIALVALVMLGVGIGVPVSRSLGGGFTTGPDRPVAYHVVYRQDFLTAGDTVRWEDLSVHRPFEAADLLYTAAPGPGVAPSSGTVSTPDALYDVKEGGGLVLVGGRQPGPPSGDQDLLTELPDLLSRGLAADEDRSATVAGRSCHVYRLFEPPSGPIKPLAGPGNHDDLCIDGDGLVLGEQWTLNGRLVLTRRALTVALSAPAMPSVSGAATPPTGTPTPLAYPTAGTDSFLAAPPAPPGFAPRPTVRFIEPSPQTPQAILAESTVWSFADGAASVTVEAGREPPGQLPWQPGDTVTRSARLAGLGPATSALRSDGAEVRVDVGNGEWVRVHGTVPVSALVGYAGRLRLNPGGGSA